MKYVCCLWVFMLTAGIGMPGAAAAQSAYPAAGKQGGELRKEARENRRELLRNQKEARESGRDSLAQRKEAREEMIKMRGACKRGERKACEELREREMMMRHRHDRKTMRDGGKEQTQDKPGVAESAPGNMGK